MPLVDPLLAHCGRARGRLTSALTRLEQGGSAAVVVTGPPGHGQHALLRWAATAAEARGLQALTARATEPAATIPHALTSALLASRVAAPAPAPGDGPDALLAALHARPTLLAVEDAFRADPESARLLAALVGRQQGAAPLLLLMSTHGTPPRLPEVLARMGSGAGVTELVLPAVDEHGAATMAAAICGTDPSVDERFARAAAEAAGGNPAILDDALRRLAQRGHPPVAAHIPRIRELAAAATTDHVARVLRTLRPAERTALRALAAARGVLDLPALRHLAGTRPEDEPALWSALEATGLVTPGRPLPGLEPATRTRVLADMPPATGPPCAGAPPNSPTAPERPARTSPRSSSTPRRPATTGSCPPCATPTRRPSAGRTTPTPPPASAAPSPNPRTPWNAPGWNWNWPPPRP
ncbi:AAA family ATPase [Streptomyces luteoverticillatus]|uniref:AAA family ATPase n=1 Tax=Streptomyces luteoverticillatus TaxID=66425 RepID=UPI001F0B7F89|nr:AAA family ATPase [Streptomyces luteoverticillatus]